MPKYEVTVLVEFTGELEADSREEAEQLAHTSWGETFDLLGKFPKDKGQ